MRLKKKENFSVKNYDILLLFNADSNVRHFFSAFNIRNYKILIMNRRRF